MLWSLVVVLSLSSQAFARKHFIVGGENVDIADYPWQGSFRTASESHNCGCVSVGGVFVVSAAHCGGSSSYTMEFGASNLGEGTIFGIDTVVLHPDYGTGPGFSPNDISVITATEEVSGENISPATMANTADNPGGLGWITGWGRTCGGCAIPTELQGIEIPIIPDADCEAIWGDSFQPSNMICVLDTDDASSSACNGDSGGPLTVGSTLYGITSWIASGCLSDYPSVYVRVGVFQSWVCDETGGVAVGC